MKNEIIYKEDAIEVVCDNCPISFKDKCEWKDNGHCSMNVALIVLPSVEATGDLISRQWLLDLYETPKDGDGVEWKVPLEVIRQNILDAPSADAVSFEDAMQIRNTILVKEYLRGRRDAEAAQGEWICKGDDYAVCSECGGSSGTQFDGVEPIPRTTAFCPHCGARMKGGENK